MLPTKGTIGEPRTHSIIAMKSTLSGLYILKYLVLSFWYASIKNIFEHAEHDCSHRKITLLYLINKYLETRCFLFLDSCDSITPPANGSYSLVQENGITTAVFKCDTGTTMSGPYVSTCQNNATWDNAPPLCGGYF